MALLRKRLVGEVFKMFRSKTSDLHKPELEALLGSSGPIVGGDEPTQPKAKSKAKGKAATQKNQRAIQNNVARRSAQKKRRTAAGADDDENDELLHGDEEDNDNDNEEEEEEDDEDGFIHLFLKE